MKALSFNLSGKFAHFKKPDVNEYVYFTYNNIPKPTLLGLLGAIIGLKGYSSTKHSKKKKKSEDENTSIYPEFYERLKHLKISIIPSQTALYGRFSKKIQVFINGVGYASEEEGGNLIIREQWLENPSWQILIKDDGTSEFQKISDFLFNKKAIFIPYLGKNDHFADISDVKMLELSNLQTDETKVKSIFLSKDIEEIKFARGLAFSFREFYPVDFNDLMFYKLEDSHFTNKNCVIKSKENWYKFGDSAICFL